MSRTKHHRSQKKNINRLSADFRRGRNKHDQAKAKHAMQKGNYDNIPKFKQDARYDYL